MDAWGARTQVGRFEDDLGELFDVYLTGYADLAAAGDDSRELHELGYRPQVVVLPAAPSLAQTRPRSPFASGYPLLP